MKKKFLLPMVVVILLNVIFITGNCFSQWLQQNPLPQDIDLIFVKFINTSTGWAVGTNGTILKTTSGGTNWTTQYSGTTDLLWYVSFTDANTGWVVGYNGTIRKTINGGTTWTSQTSGISEHLYSVYFYDTNVGCAVGGGGTILETTNGGDNWTPQTIGTSENLYSVYIFNDITDAAGDAWICGDIGIILKNSEENPLPYL